MLLVWRPEPHREYEFQSGVNKGGKKLSDIDRVPDYWPDHETVRHDMLDYAFEVEHVDNHLGRMIAELEKRGLLDNTLIIVTSDHGMPFPRVKGYAYHDSNHVPLAVRWPRGMRNPGRVIEDFVDFTDIAPTILDYAGIAWKDSGMMPITGKSWRPILESTKAGRVVPERDHVLIGKERTDVGRPHNWGYPIRGIVTAEHLYLHNYEPTRWPAGNPETGYLDTDGSPTKSLILDLGRANRTDRFWQLNFGMRPADELYDLRTDRDCVRNLAPDPAHAERMTALRQRMETMLKAQGDPRMDGRGRGLRRLQTHQRRRPLREVHARRKGQRRLGQPDRLREATHRTMKSLFALLASVASDAEPWSGPGSIPFVAKKQDAVRVDVDSDGGRGGELVLLASLPHVVELRPGLQAQERRGQGRLS